MSLSAMLKKYLEWRLLSDMDNSPPLACPAPLVALAPAAVTTGIVASSTDCCWLPSASSSSVAAALAAAAAAQHSQSLANTSPPGTSFLSTSVTPSALSPPGGRIDSGPSAFSTVVPSITFQPPPGSVCSLQIPVPALVTSPPSVSIPGLVAPVTLASSSNNSTGGVAAASAGAVCGTAPFASTTASDVYQQFMCIPGLLERLQAQINSSATCSSNCTPATSLITTTISTTSLAASTNYGHHQLLTTTATPIKEEVVLKSHMNSTSFKPIPCNEKVDLARFRVKDPNDWLVDDVVAWMLDVAKRHNIPFEEMNMHRFASINGQQMLTMSETDFVERDPMWGALIYAEFKKCTDDTLIEDYMKNNPPEDDSQMRPSTSQDAPKLALLQPAAPQMQTQLQQSLNHAINQTLNQAINQTLNQSLFTSHNIQSLNQSLASSLAAGLSTGLSPMSLGLLPPNGLSPSSPMFGSNQMQPKISPQPPSNEMMKYHNAPASIASTDYEEPSTIRMHHHKPEHKIKKNKDGRPRKRSQHTKGNKLWEFIRDALKDPTTCPSVVRWEDPIEGVFRIVESEKLARLWGEKKNNTKMTYEKLSRAMRTYYEKQILVPVPKTGLYPKKLVYKFGPGAHGWDTIKHERR